MNPRLYSFSVVSIGIYALLGCLMAFLVLIHEAELAIISSLIFPLFLFVKYIKNLASIYDFRVVYLGSILVWSLGKSLSVFMSYGSSVISGQFVSVYMLSMVIAPALVLIFKVPSPDTYFIKIQPNKLHHARIVKFSAFVWLLLSITLYWSLGAPESNLTAFVLKQTSQGFLLVFASVLFMQLSSRETFFSVSFLFIIAGITIFVFLQGPLNRTSLLLPLLIIILARLSQSKLIAMKFQSAKSLFGFILAIPFFSILLLIADVQKQTSLSLLDIIDFVATRPEFIFEAIRNSNYLPDKESASYYFNSVNAILESKKEIPGGLFYQLASSLMPRIFFPDKGVTDLSQIMWENGFLTYPLYYEIFLEPVIDSRVFGVIIYYTLFLFFVWVSLVSVTMHKKGFRGIYSRSVYLLNLLVLFMIIRGPVIFIIWYAMLPNMILWWWFLAKRLNRHPIRILAIS